MGEIIPSESLSRVTYRGINGMYSQKTKQPYMLSARKNRTRKKKSAVEDHSQKSRSKCHVFVKQVRFSYGESPRTPPLEGTSLHRRNISMERPWGILSLFTTSLPLWVKSHQSLSRVTNTGINSTHSQKRKQTYIRSASKNRTRKMKSAVEEDLHKSSEKNKKNKPLE